MSTSSANVPLTVLVGLVATSLALAQSTERQAHPLAPSLPTLTKEEETKAKEVVDRFILFDTGKATGPGAKKSAKELQNLGPETIFVLVDGYNRAADMEASCPAVVIGKKIASIIRSTADRELLQFLKENVGAGATAFRHKGTTQDLKLACILRLSQVGRLPPTPVRGPERELVKVGPRTKKPPESNLDAVQGAPSRSKADEPKKAVPANDRPKTPTDYSALAAAAKNPDPTLARAARISLVASIKSESSDRLQSLLSHAEVDVRVTAIREVEQRNLRWIDQLAERLRDENSDVRQAARQTLVRLARGTVDFGPRTTETRASDFEAAANRWRDWWNKRPKSP